MPASWVLDEEKWEKAKELAEKQGRGGDYAYITGIYKKMKGGIRSKKMQKSVNNLLNEYNGLILKSGRNGSTSKSANKLNKSADIEIENIEMILKAKKGQQVAGAKYFKRVPKAGGGYHYFYTKADYKKFLKKQKGAKKKIVVRVKAKKAKKDPSGMIEKKKWRGKEYEKIDDGKWKEIKKKSSGFSKKDPVGTVKPSSKSPTGYLIRTPKGDKPARKG